jgi:hypothetical protein
MMTPEEKVDALLSAGINDPHQARLMLDKLESAGLTIYKKKVFTNGRRPNSSQTMTPELAKKIRAFFRANPTASQQQIANIFNVNSGRVNEALQGAH